MTSDQADDDRAPDCAERAGLDPARFSGAQVTRINLSDLDFDEALCLPEERYGIGADNCELVLLRQLSLDLRSDLTSILLNATATAKSIGGDGLSAPFEALARIRQVAERMRRRIGVCSTAKTVAEPNRQSQRTATYRSASGLVVVVDGDDDSRFVMGEVLNDHGYATLLIATVDDALKRLATVQLPPEVIVLDLNLPAVAGWRDGWRFLAERKQQARLRCVPVLVVSSNADIERQLAATDIGYVAKPSCSDAIMAGVTRAISRRALPHNGRCLPQRAAAQNDDGADEGHERAERCS